MKFCIEKTISYTNVDRVKITTKKEDYFERNTLYNVNYMCNVLIKVTEDFNIEHQFPIVSDTCSIQIRPKGIFKSNKGYFYKGNDKQRVYLSKEEELKMINYIEKAKNYIEAIS